MTICLAESAVLIYFYDVDAAIIQAVLICVPVVGGLSLMKS